MNQWNKKKIKYREKINLEQPNVSVLQNNFRDVVIGKNEPVCLGFDWPTLPTTHFTRSPNKKPLKQNQKLNEIVSIESDTKTDKFTPENICNDRQHVVQNNPESKLFLTGDFPSLSSSCLRFNIKVEQHVEPDSTCKDEVLVKDENKERNDQILPIDELDKLTENLSSCTLVKFDQTPRKKPRKNDGISLDVLAAIKFASEKKQKGQRKTLRKSKVSTYSGNPLDADKPIRKKGKVREIPKKKSLTKIKKAIVLSRMKRTCIRNIDLCGVQLPEIEKELSTISLTTSLRRKYIIKEEPPDENEIIDEIDNQIKLSIHSKKFRSYCSNTACRDLLENGRRLITTLRSFQDKLYNRDPAKAKRKRRYVCGFKETIKFLHCEEIKLILVATNLEACIGDPLEKMINDLKILCQKKNVPIAFTGTAYDLGYWTCKKNRISIIGILNYQGCEDVYKQFTNFLQVAQEDYKNKIEEAGKKLGLKPQVNIKVEDEIKETILEKLGNIKIEPTKEEKQLEQAHLSSFLESIEQCIKK